MFLVLATWLFACSEIPPTVIPVTAEPDASPTSLPTDTPTIPPTPTPPNPLTIESMRSRAYLGSDIVIEQKLTAGSNYSRYISSYESDGLKIFALLTVPNGTRPSTGWPVIIFNHGYIPPSQYKTAERYVAYVDAFARNGYIVFKSDFRGHGNSEGEALGGYGTPDYTIDVLNAFASMKKYKDADPHRIGMWGHSMGGQLTLRAMVVSNEIKAGVIWSGVVGSYTDLLYHWRSTATPIPSPVTGRRWRDAFIDQYGAPDQNPVFWDSISPNAYLADISGPIQLHHSTTDASVPYQFSEELDQELVAAGKTVEFFPYPGDDHNISKHLALALQRSVAFFDRFVKK